MGVDGDKSRRSITPVSIERQRIEESGERGAEPSKIRVERTTRR